MNIGENLESLEWVGERYGDRIELVIRDVLTFLAIIVFGGYKIVIFFICRGEFFFGRSLIIILYTINFNVKFRSFSLFFIIF